VRAAGRSRTSDWVAALRALNAAAPADLDVTGDSVALELLPPGLGWSLRSLAGSPLLAGWAHRALGAVSLGLSDDVPLRTAAIDAALRRSVREGTEQLVILGAGLDARAWRLAELGRSIVYELDHPATQAYKLERIGSLPPLARAVRHLAIDFERQRIDDVLAAAGFLPQQPSAWVWEGVTMYLTGGAIEATLDAIGRLSAPGSRLAMSYVPPDYGPAWIRALGSGIGRVIGEPLRGLLAPQAVAARLDARGFCVESDDSATEWAARWWPRRRRKVRAWERLAIAVKRAGADAGAEPPGAAADPHAPA
jgi:methyltransferase (TIGR00027 family)